MKIYNPISEPKALELVKASNLFRFTATIGLPYQDVSKWVTAETTLTLQEVTNLLERMDISVVHIVFEDNAQEISIFLKDSDGETNTSLVTVKLPEYTG